MLKTYSAKPSDVTRGWYVFDASEVSLGRLCTVLATYLMGKNKPMFTHHIDCGDNVIVINADKLRVTGNKMNDKMYYRHSGYPGGLKETALKDQIVKNPAFVIEKAVYGMIPVNRLRPDRMKRLKVYAGPDHSHAAQKPVTISLKKGSK